MFSKCLLSKIHILRKTEVKPTNKIVIETVFCYSCDKNVDNSCYNNNLSCVQYCSFDLIKTDTIL